MVARLGDSDTKVVRAKMFTKYFVLLCIFQCAWCHLEDQSNTHPIRNKNIDLEGDTSLRDDLPQHREKRNDLGDRSEKASFEIPKSSGTFLCASSGGIRRAKRDLSTDIIIENPVAKILTFNASSENTLNEDTFDELTREACSNPKCNLINYIQRQLIDRNYTGFMGKVLRQICSSEVQKKYPFFGRCLENMDFMGDSHLIKSLVDKKLFYPADGKSGYKDEVYAIVQDEAKKRNEFTLLVDFRPKEYAYDHANDTSSVVNTMLSHVCNVTTKWPSPVKKFKIFKNGVEYECDASDVKSWWDKIVSVFASSCSVIHDELGRRRRRRDFGPQA